MFSAASRIYVFSLRIELLNSGSILWACLVCFIGIIHKPISTANLQCVSSVIYAVQYICSVQVNIFFKKKGTYQYDQRRNGYSKTGVRGKSYLITLMYLVVKSSRMCFIYVITTIVRICIPLLVIWSGSAPALCSKKNKNRSSPAFGSLATRWVVSVNQNGNHRVTF